ncbi:putative phage tail protein [Sodalis glossinidius str. 'morsitans']|uniref:Phage tail protein n=1 Tax=Sodalis glossinidius (strain morsitans) TaxID=343509 RepID=Q2NUW2_SODGM|nr:tail protein [Sodalis glossinidius]BAE74063.1 putative phage tail protein [Sodalis glossinidius str. 'morsitans']
MPSPVNATERIALQIGGVAHDDWLDIEVDADLLTPEAGWAFTVGLSQARLPPEVRVGALAKLRAGDALIMTGQMDELRHEVARGQHTLSVYGRDAAAVLVDCSAPLFSAQDMSLQEVVTQIVRPLGITYILLQATSPLAAKKVSIDPGDTAWGALRKAVEASGLWPWVSADGTLVVGGPDYSTPLIMRRDGQGNNLLRLAVSDNISSRYSEVTVLAQGHGSAQADGRHDCRSQVKDVSVPVYRPLVAVVGDTDSDEEVHFRARKLMADARLNSLLITTVVRGLHTAAGQLWAPGQQVRIHSEPHGIDDTFYLMHRRFSGGQPLQTLLTLREDGVWLPDSLSNSKRLSKVKGAKALWQSWEQIDG